MSPLQSGGVSTGYASRAGRMLRTTTTWSFAAGISACVARPARPRKRDELECVRCPGARGAANGRRRMARRSPGIARGSTVRRNLRRSSEGGVVRHARRAATRILHPALSTPQRREHRRAARRDRSWRVSHVCGQQRSDAHVGRLHSPACKPMALSVDQDGCDRADLCDRSVPDGAAVATCGHRYAITRCRLRAVAASRVWWRSPR